MTDDEKVCVGQFVSSKTTATFDLETGYWTVISDVQEGRRFTDGPWKFKNIAIKSMDTNLAHAQETVVKALQHKLQSLGGVLWNLPDGESDAPIPNVFEITKNSTA